MTTPRFHYTISQKLQILQRYEEGKVEDNQIQHHATRAQIKEWTEKKEKFESLSSNKQQRAFILHPGPKLKYAELYTFLYSCVKEMRSENQAINHEMLIKLAIQEQPNTRDLSETGKRSLIDRFMKLYNLSLRAITSTNASQNGLTAQEQEVISRTFKEDYLRTIQEFGITSESVFNMDQSAFNYEIIPKRTIEEKGSQRVVVLTKGGEKKRATLISLINAAGQKFRQFVILKGTHRSRIQASMEAENDVTTYFSCQPNAWTDQDQIESWLETIWWPIAQSINGPKILIIDSYPLHEDLKNQFEKYNTIVKFVPKGLTWALQPLDGVYHKTYKKFARSFFLNTQLREIENETDWRKLLAECVKEIFLKIDQEVVLGSWKLIGLEYPLSNDRPFLNDSRMIIEEMGLEENPNRMEEEDDNLFS